MNINDRAPADSYYESTRNYTIDAPMLRGDTHADVVIIGGGLTGVSTALHLANRGVNVALLESRAIGWGASGRSGGQIIAGYSADQDAIEKLVGDATARELWTHSLNAVAFVRECVARYEIDCDLKWGYLHAAVKPGQSRALQTWGRHLQDAYDYRSLRYLPRDELRAVLASDSYHGAMRDSASGHLHPLNYCLGLARAAADAGARLHHNSGVQSVQPRGAKLRVQTARGAITCEQVVYAGNAYLGKLQPQLARMIMPVATCIIATERLGESAARALIANDAAVADTNFVLDYYRLSADNRMLFGGRVSYAAREPRRLTAALRRRMTRVFPQLTDARIDFAWGGYVAITRNRAPGIGQLAGGRGWFAHGFSGHGMALSGYAGRLLAAAITGERADMDAFTRIPHANFPGGAMLRMPALVAAMSYRIMRDRLAR